MRNTNSGANQLFMKQVGFFKKKPGEVSITIF